MSRLFLVAVLFMGFAASASAESADLIVPAGTILQCTLQEPQLSSKTVGVGEPILCHLTALVQFGRPVLPRGAFLGGRFDKYRNPGRFFGKGWIKLEFDRLYLPAEVLPLSTRVIAVPRFEVDLDARIRGRGHARRDALGWTFPLLWPYKLLTLPMRGPRPILQGETRVTLKLLNDLVVPAASLASVVGSPSPPVATNRRAVFSPGLVKLTATTSPKQLFPQRAEQLVANPTENEREGRLTVLMFKDGKSSAAIEYWIEAGYLHFVTPEGKQLAIALEEVDFVTTVQHNHERGVTFVLRPTRKS